MPLVYAVAVGLLVVTVVVNAALGYWIYTRHGDVRGSRWFVLHLAASTVWVVVFALSILVVDETVRGVARQLGDKAALWTFLAWIVFAARYSHTDFHKRPTVSVVLGTILAVSLLPTFVEPLGGLFYADFAYPIDPFPHVVIEPRLPFALTAIATATFVVYGLYELGRYLLATPNRSTARLLALVVGSLSIEVAIALGNFGFFGPSGMSHGPFGVLPASVLTAVALFRFELFDIQPVARNAVVEELQDPVVVLDGDETVVDYNRAATAVWPDLEERLGQPVSAACPELDSVLAADDGRVRAGDSLSLSVDGDRRHFSLTASTVGEETGADSDLVALLLRDVTELEQSRWQLQTQNERLDQVAATVSHDLRNPISVADGYAKIVSETVEEPEPTAEDVAEARELVGKIGDAHHRMEEIVADVLAIAREGQSVEETEQVALRAVAEDAWETVDTGAATLTVRTDRQIEADRSKLQSLLENLFRNAVEHGSTSPPSHAREDAEERGSTTSRADAREDPVEHGTEPVSVTVSATEDGFAVQDDGPGVDEEAAEQVFEYGFSMSHEGTGLGLSIVRTIAESHGWTVQLEQDADGARFLVCGLADSTTPRGPADDSVRPE